MSKIMGVMLVTGEEVIGEVQETLEKRPVVVMKKPRVIALMTSPDGRQGLGLVPWTKSNMDSTVFLHVAHMLCEPFVPLGQIEDAYLQETSGIQLASSLPSRGNGK